MRTARSWLVGREEPCRPVDERVDNGWEVLNGAGTQVVNEVISGDRIQVWSTHVPIMPAATHLHISGARHMTTVGWYLLIVMLTLWVVARVCQHLLMGRRCALTAGTRVWTDTRRTLLAWRVRGDIGGARRWLYGVTIVTHLVVRWLRGCITELRGSSVLPQRDLRLTYLGNLNHRTGAPAQAAWWRVHLLVAGWCMNVSIDCMQRLLLGKTLMLWKVLRVGHHCWVILSHHRLPRTIAKLHVSWRRHQLVWVHHRTTHLTVVVSLHCHPSHNQLSAGRLLRVAAAWMLTVIAWHGCRRWHHGWVDARWPLLVHHIRWHHRCSILGYMTVLLLLLCRHLSRVSSHLWGSIIHHLRILCCILCRWMVRGTTLGNGAINLGRHATHLNQVVAHVFWDQHLTIRVKHLVNYCFVVDIRVQINVLAD